MENLSRNSMLTLGAITGLVFLLTKKAKATEYAIDSPNSTVENNTTEVTNANKLGGVESILDQIDNMTSTHDVLPINQIPLNSEISKTSSTSPDYTEDYFNTTPPTPPPPPQTVINPPEENNQTQTIGTTVTTPVQTTEPIYTGVPSNTETSKATQQKNSLYYIIKPDKILDQLPIKGPSPVSIYNNNVLYSTYNIEGTFNPRYKITMDSIKQVNMDLYNYLLTLYKAEETLFTATKQQYLDRVAKVGGKNTNNTISLLNIVINLADFNSLNIKAQQAYTDYNVFQIPNYTFAANDDIKAPSNPGTISDIIYISDNSSYVKYNMLGKPTTFYGGQIVGLINTIDGKIVEFDLKNIYTIYKENGVPEVFPAAAKYMLSFLAKKEFANILRYSSAPAWLKFNLGGRTILAPTFEAINFLLKYDTGWTDLKPKLHAMAKKYDVSIKSYKKTTQELKTAASLTNKDWTIKDYVAVKLMKVALPKPTDTNYSARQEQINIKLMQKYKNDAGNERYISNYETANNLGGFCSTITSYINIYNGLKFLCF